MLQLLKVLEGWIKTLDEGGSIDAIYLDYMRAFDKVPDNPLNYKLNLLNRHGIKENVGNWQRTASQSRSKSIYMEGDDEWNPPRDCSLVHVYIMTSQMIAN